MPKIKANGIELFYQDTGEGTEAIVFSHGYLMDHTMFNGQVERLKGSYRCICFEHRGHGQSEIPRDGYSMDTFVDDAIALIEALELGPVHFVGMSTGGFVGMRIAIKRPELLRSLTLIDTSAEAEPPEALKKNTLLLNTVKTLGWWPVIGQVLPMMFHSSFLNDRTRRSEKNYWKNAVTSQNKKAMTEFGHAIFARDDVLEALKQIIMPALIIVGEFDVLTTPTRSQNMADAIDNSVLCIVEDAGHCAAIEKADVVADRMLDFYRTRF